jgi:simple sugar transport system permease protein
MSTASATGNATTTVAAVVPDTRSKLISGLAEAIIGALALWGFGLSSRVGDNTHTLFGLKFDPNQVGGLSPISAPSQPVALALSSLAILCGLVRAFAPMTRKVQIWVDGVYFASIVLAFLVWVAAGSTVGLNIPSIIALTAAGAVPLILGSLSGLLCERSGVVNIAIEGQFLFGAFSAVITASSTGSLWAGAIAGCLGGALMGSLLAVFANRYLIEQVVLGVVLNLLALGITGFLYKSLMQTNQSSYNSVSQFDSFRIPGLASIWVIGPVLFDQPLIIYLTVFLVVLVHLGLFRTRWGLRTRAVGEHPAAADTVGIKVLRLRYRNVMLGGAFAGLGGAWLVGNVGNFTEAMTNGKGFIALAAVIFGRWSPFGALAAAGLFGFTDALANQTSSLQLPVPSDLLSTLPYVATLFAVAGLIGRVRAPAADGKPYIKG